MLEMKNQVHQHNEKALYIGYTVNYLKLKDFPERSYFRSIFIDELLIIGV